MLSPLPKVVETTDRFKKRAIYHCNAYFHKAYFLARTEERKQEFLERAQSHVMNWENENLFSKLHENYRRARGIMDWQ